MYYNDVCCHALQALGASIRRTAVAIFHFTPNSLEWMDLPGSAVAVLADVHCDLYLPHCFLHSGESLAPQLFPSHVSYLVLQACGACFQHCMYACCDHHKTHDADAVAESHAPGGAVIVHFLLNAMISNMAVMQGLT